MSHVFGRFFSTSASSSSSSHRPFTPLPTTTRDLSLTRRQSISLNYEDDDEQESDERDRVRGRERERRGSENNNSMASSRPRLSLLSSHTKLRRRQVIAVVFILIWAAIWVIPRAKRWKDHLAYGTRPLWDKDEAPNNLLAHYSSSTLGKEGNEKEWCSLHGWQVRNSRKEVWDAVLYTNEYDLLLLRLHSLAPSVSKHILLLSNTTFTGLPIPYTLPSHTPSSPAENLPSELQPFKDKLWIYHHPGRSLAHGEDPFVPEGERRIAMTNIINSLVTREGKSSSMDVAPLILQSDLDELPTLSTLQLLQTCSAPSPLHLQLHQYIYSYEWAVGSGSWRATIITWFGEQRDVGYGHFKRGQDLLAASGTHCSFCFKSIQDFRTKMSGYSHADRLWNSPSPKYLLSTPHIQEVLCTGEDLFGMLPEAYRWRDLLAWYKPDRSKDFTSSLLPPYLFENPRFKFLLPGGCIREDEETLG